jgi:hypothetical protein
LPNFSSNIIAMASTCFKALAAVFLTFTATTHAFNLNPIQQLAARNPYYGGYALPESNLGCPATTETCDGSFCCPVGTWCSPAINGPYCCPTSASSSSKTNLLELC